MSFFFKEEA